MLVFKKLETFVIYLLLVFLFLSCKAKVEYFKISITKCLQLSDKMVVGFNILNNSSLDLLIIDSKKFYKHPYFDVSGGCLYIYSKLFEEPLLPEWTHEYSGLLASFLAPKEKINIEYNFLLNNTNIPYESDKLIPDDIKVNKVQLQFAHFRIDPSKYKLPYVHPDGSAMKYQAIEEFIFDCK